MVSIRCKMLVKEELKNLGLHYIAVDLGEVEIMENITAEQRATIKAALLQSGLELLDDKKAILIETIKGVIIEMIHYSEKIPKVKFSDYLSQKLDYDYTYLSNLFSETEGITIEHFCNPGIVIINFYMAHYMYSFSFFSSCCVFNSIFKFNDKTN